MKLKILTFLIFPFFVVSSTLAQKNENISTKEKNEIVSKTLDLIQRNYIYPERTNQINKYVMEKMKAGGYDSLTKLIPFLEVFERDIQQQSKDTHLGMGLSPERVKQIVADSKNENSGKKEEITPEWLERMQFENFRLRKIERLEGNIGYFNFLNFTPLEPSKKTLIGAMNFLRYSSAIIIDLRDNGGGNSETMDFLLSYFLQDSVQLTEMRFRKDNKIEKKYTIQDESINKIPEGTPVYILVSNRTASAAEGFTYTLQQYKRATIIGEQTKGEGNPGQLFAITDALYIMIPTIEGINPVSKKSIDGVGVTPDIKVASSKALTKAKLEICRTLSEKATVKELKRAYDWQIPYLENELNPEPLSESIVNAIVGSYEGGRKVLYENSSIVYVNSQGGKEKIEYMGKGVFQNTEKHFLRLVMPTTSKPVPYFEWVWDDGGKPQKISRVNK